MYMNKEMPKRKNIRMRQYDYSMPGAYFVTICTENRKNYFWEGNLNPQRFYWRSVNETCIRPVHLPLSAVGKTAADELEIWHRTYRNTELYSYVIMPNHIHIMVVILQENSEDGGTAPDLKRMVKQFKGAVTKKVGYPIWQKSFMEHIVRDKTDYEIRTGYICENPIRWYYDEMYTEG